MERIAPIIWRLIVTLMAAICVLGAALLDGGIVQESSSSGQCLSISLDKTSYLLDEPIWLDIYKTCSEDSAVDTLTLATRRDWFGVLVIDAAGDTLEDKSPMPDIIGSLSSPSYTSDTLFGLTNLQEDFGDAETIHHYRTLRAGSYTVKVVYPRLIESIELSFSVLDPTGIETVAHDLYVSGVVARFTDTDRSVAELERLLTEFPNSVYAPAACAALVQVYHIYRPDEQLAIEFGAKVVMDYPNSGYAVRKQGYLVNKYGRKKADKILENLIAKSGSERLRMGTKGTRKLEE